MFGKSFTLFRLFGFAVGIDASWIFLALLVTWTLASGLFPQQFEGLSTGVYWTMGAVGALGLFVSIILHELSHALVARRYNIPIKGITLFIFGGVAHMEDEPPSAKSEFLMAIAGPIMSFVLAFVFGGLGAGAQVAGLPLPVVGVLAYLGWINGLLAVFNMIPAFPLDGGRVLRSALWAWKDDFRNATRIASAFGSGFAFLLMFLGVLAFFSGNLIGGFWWFMIGLFVRHASQMSYQQALVRHALEGEEVARFMKESPVCVPPGISIQELVDDYVYRYHHKTFPVVEDDKLLACVNTREIRNVPREEWSSHGVKEVATECNEQNMVKPHDDAMHALMVMSRNNLSRLLVVEDGQLVGIVTLKDLLRFISVKLDLEGNSRESQQLAQIATQAG